MRVVACYSQGMGLLIFLLFFFYETHNKEIHRNTKHLMGKSRASAGVITVCLFIVLIKSMLQK